MATSPNKDESLTFRCSLAPMVRLGTLPLRLLALERGAHWVYSEELPAAKLALCTRRYDARLRTMDWVLQPRRAQLLKFSDPTQQAGVGSAEVPPLQDSMTKATKLHPRTGSLDSLESRGSASGGGGGGCSGANESTMASPPPPPPPPPCILRTCALEAGRLVVQLGCSNPDEARVACQALFGSPENDASATIHATITLQAMDDACDPPNSSSNSCNDNGAQGVVTAANQLRQLEENGNNNGFGGPSFGIAAVDLNLGCPQRAAVEGGTGCALFQATMRVKNSHDDNGGSEDSCSGGGYAAAQVVAALREHTPRGVAVTCKVRLCDGDEDEDSFLEFNNRGARAASSSSSASSAASVAATVWRCVALVEAGAEGIAIHGRRPSERCHSSLCRWSEVALVAAALRRRFPRHRRLSPQTSLQAPLFPASTASVSGGVSGSGGSSGSGGGGGGGSGGGVLKWVAVNGDALDAASAQAYAAQVAQALRRVNKRRRSEEGGGGCEGEAGVEEEEVHVLVGRGALLAGTGVFGVGNGDEEEEEENDEEAAKEVPAAAAAAAAARSKLLRQDRCLDRATLRLYARYASLASQVENSPLNSTFVLQWMLHARLREKTAAAVPAFAVDDSPAAAAAAAAASAEAGAHPPTTTIAATVAAWPASSANDALVAAVKRLRKARTLAAVAAVFKVKDATDTCSTVTTTGSSHDSSSRHPSIGAVVFDWGVPAAPHHRYSKTYFDALPPPWSKCGAASSAGHVRRGEAVGDEEEEEDSESSLALGQRRAARPRWRGQFQARDQRGGGSGLSGVGNGKNSWATMGPPKDAVAKARVEATQVLARLKRKEACCPTTTTVDATAAAVSDTSAAAAAEVAAAQVLGHALAASMQAAAAALDAAGATAARTLTGPVSSLKNNGGSKRKRGQWRSDAMNDDDQNEEGEEEEEEEEEEDSPCARLSGWLASMGGESSTRGRKARYFVIDKAKPSERRLGYFAPAWRCRCVVGGKPFDGNAYRKSRRLADGDAALLALTALRSSSSAPPTITDTATVDRATTDTATTDTVATAKEGEEANLVNARNVSSSAPQPSIAASALFRPRQLTLLKRPL